MATLIGLPGDTIPCQVGASYPEAHQESLIYFLGVELNFLCPTQSQATTSNDGKSPLVPGSSRSSKSQALAFRTAIPHFQQLLCRTLPTCPVAQTRCCRSILTALWTTAMKGLRKYLLHHRSPISCKKKVTHLLESGRELAILHILEREGESCIIALQRRGQGGIIMKASSPPQCNSLSFLLLSLFPDFHSHK